jgi:hypothetical protein
MMGLKETHKFEFMNMWKCTNKKKGVDCIWNQIGWHIYHMFTLEIIHLGLGRNHHFPFYNILYTLWFAYLKITSKWSNYSRVPKWTLEIRKHYASNVWSLVISITAPLYVFESQDTFWVCSLRHALILSQG